MKLGLSLLVALAVTVGLSLRATADEAKSRPNFLVFPIKTDLQRELAMSPRADAYLLFDVESCSTGKTFDPKRLDSEDLRKALTAISHEIGMQKPLLMIAYRCTNGFPDRDEREALDRALRAVCRQAGFFDIRASFQGTGGSWGDKVRPFERIVDEADPVESPLVNDVARLYPVRTRFSRFLLGNADVDGYLVLRRPIEGSFRDFVPATRREIGQLLDKVHFAHKRRLALYFTTTTQGQAAVMRFMQQEAPRNESAADRSVQTLGFRSSSSGFCPMGVSPEDLVGKQAPDFALQTLDDGRLQFHEATRGKVTVIAFWGVACGACCEEAPYLSALYDRYKKQGLTVIGVNAYNESRQKVEGFVRSRHLTHTIALMGGKVAKDYTVASYQITWLVDRNGKIADYLLGFDAGDEKLLEKSITQLLR
jgi:peroxiredoxin